VILLILRYPNDRVVIYTSKAVPVFVLDPATELLADQTPQQAKKSGEQSKLPHDGVHFRVLVGCGRRNRWGNNPFYQAKGLLQAHRPIGTCKFAATTGGAKVNEPTIPRAGEKGEDFLRFLAAPVERSTAVSFVFTILVALHVIHVALGH